MKAPGNSIKYLYPGRRLQCEVVTGHGRGGTNLSIQPWATINNSTKELPHSHSITYATRNNTDEGISVVDHILNSGPQCFLQPNELLMATEVEIAELYLKDFKGAFRWTPALPEKRNSMSANWSRDDCLNHVADRVERGLIYCRYYLIPRYKLRTSWKV